MPLPKPVLDDRSFDQLVQEARARIPRYTPEWTNFNDSDPGMTLVKLQAWLTETILFRLNRLPELTYLKFLDLLNITPRPAVAARAQLTFKLKKLAKASDPLVVLIPPGTQVAVDDPDLPQELVFETDRSLVALNAALAAILVPSGASSLMNVATFDPDKGSADIPNPFYPFGQSPAVGALCYLGFVLRPQGKKRSEYTLDRFPAGELDLTTFVPQSYEPGPNDTTVAGPEAMQCLFPWQVQTQDDSIAWELFTSTEGGSRFLTGSTGPDWTLLKAVDETAALARSGHVYLEVPGNASLVSFAQLERDFWTLAGLSKAPTSGGELSYDLNNGLLDISDLKDDDWHALGIPDASLGSLADLKNYVNAHLSALNFNAVPPESWVKAGYSASPVPYPLAWVRLRLLSAPERDPLVARFAINTVSATAAVTRTEELLGISNGRPNQVFKLRRAPLLVDPPTNLPDLNLVLRDPNRAGREDEFEDWTVAPDFFGQGSDSAVFRLDPQTGEISFGDGHHGRIPVAGLQVIARKYRVGGGEVGNAGPGTISKLKSALGEVDSVSNYRAAAGGQDAEALEEVMLRAPHDLRSRDRAVTADDFADLARQAPGVPVQRAYALAEKRFDFSASPVATVDAPGAVTVVILPESKQARPSPSEDQLRLVCAHLDARRLITTQLFVSGPRYHDIQSLSAEIWVERGADLKRSGDQAKQRLLEYFHPLRGGEDGKGWPFGQDIYFGNVYRQLLSLPGVLSVQCLIITNGESAKCNDLLRMEDYDLFFLDGDKIDLQVKYDYSR